MAAQSFALSPAIISSTFSLVSTRFGLPEPELTQNTGCGSIER